MPEIDAGDVRRWSGVLDSWMCEKHPVHDYVLCTSCHAIRCPECTPRPCQCENDE